MILAFAVVLAAWILGEALLTTDDRPAPGTLALPSALAVLASQVVGVITHGDGAWPGALIMIAGVALRLAAIATLGAAFATALASPRLVTAGPYRLARHPSELGLLLILCGGALLLGSAWAAGLAAISLPLAALRCRREDRALAHHPGHAAWARRVGWVAPRAFRPRPHATGPATGA